MILVDDFLTGRVAAVNHEIRSMFGKNGKLNSAVVYGMDGVEHGIPLNIKPFADPMFVAKNFMTLKEAADFMGMPPEFIVVGATMGYSKKWPRIVFDRLRCLRPDFWVYMGTVKSVARVTPDGHWTVGDDPGDSLMVVGANACRSFGLVTPFHNSPDGVYFDKVEVMDSFAGNGMLGGDMAVVYAPNRN